MAKLKLEIDLIYDEDLMHGTDDEAIEWFRNDILLGDGGLILHSNEIGDTIGKVSVNDIVSYRKFDDMEDVFVDSKIVLLRIAHGMAKSGRTLDEFIEHVGNHITGGVSLMSGDGRLWFHKGGLLIAPA